jgi:hypothetical protein
LDQFAEEVQISIIEDWYKVAPSKFASFDKNIMLNMFDGALIYALQTIYKDTDWKIWKFTRTPARFWDNKAIFLLLYIHQMKMNSFQENQREYFDWLADILNVNSLDDWYRITTYDVSHHQV